MANQWISVGDAIAAICEAKAVAEIEAATFLVSLGETGKVRARVSVDMNGKVHRPRNVPLSEGQWSSLGKIDTDWFLTGEVFWPRGFVWRGMQISADDLADAIGTIRGQLGGILQPVAPLPAIADDYDDGPRLPPEGPFVTLSEALTWIAFGVSMDNDRLHEVLESDAYRERVPQDAIKAATAELAIRARAGKIALQGKFQESHRVDKRTLLTAPIEPIKLADYRQFNYLEDELRHGEGLTWWRDGPFVLDRLLDGGRCDSFIQVSVNRADLLREFPLAERLISERGNFRSRHTFTRDDPASIAPWWSVNQALAWIATGIPSYVEYVGGLETDEPGEHRPYIVQAICEAQVAESDEAMAFMETRRASWPAGGILAHAGRALLAKIQVGAVRPATTEGGKGRPMAWHEFVGIGKRETGSDWLDLNPQPLFLSDEVIAAFPDRELAGDGLRGGKAPANRQLDHDAIRNRAAQLLVERPGLKKGPAAASIIAELGNNPKTGKPWDNRGIERLIAPLWEGGQA